MSDLDALVRSFCGPFAFAGIGVSRGGAAHFHTATAQGIQADADSFWRAASISKVVTGRTVWAALHGAGLDGTEPAQELLGFSLRAPDGTAPTVAQIASHQSGLTDAGGYAVPLGQPLQDWIAQRGAAIWSGASVGTQFEYCNLGFVIIAACAEKVAGERFDTLAQRYALLDIAAGFNWSGAPSNVETVPTYRATSGRFAPQIDGNGAVVNLPDPYVPGQHTAAFSPQGGLRISLRGALQLAQSLPLHPVDCVWQNDSDRTIGEADLFQSYGWGMQILDEPAFYPRPLIGHFANAYGFCGGIWYDSQADIAFTYALNGLAMGDDDDALRTEERAIFSAIAALA